MRHAVVNAVSLCSVHIEAVFGEISLAIATGFLYNFEGRNFLITNWHVVSGCHPETRQPLDPNGSIPDRIRLTYHRADQLGVWARGEIDLNDKGGRPVWCEHPKHGPAVDVVAVDLENLTAPVHPINEVQFEDIRVSVAQDVFIVGFPKGLSGGGFFPIWKRGSIASEPDIDLNGLPKLLIDSATREGLSGSPVIAQYVGWHQVKDEPSSEDWVGTGRRLLGIYSSRVGKDQFEAQLGIVWKARVIEEIINGKMRPR